MTREPYIKPDVTSEELEPGALGTLASGGGTDPVWLCFIYKPSFGICCDG